ncbi:hypothetical protein AB8B12_07145 [Streptomyces sp. PGLac3x]
MPGEEAAGVAAGPGRDHRTVRQSGERHVIRPAPPQPERGPVRSEVVQEPVMRA